MLSDVFVEVVGGVILAILGILLKSKVARNPKKEINLSKKHRNMKIKVSGIDNTVELFYSSSAVYKKTINVSGIDNADSIFIPMDCRVKIAISGVDNVVIVPSGMAMGIAKRGISNVINYK